MMTDEQILVILDLTTHAPTGDGYPNNQREGLDIFLGTDEELIAKVREILSPKQEKPVHHADAFRKDYG